MYKYTHNTNTEIITENEMISLHDCHATQMSLNNYTLSFYFPDGFEVAQGSVSDMKLYYTGASQVDFSLLYSADCAITIYIFTENNGETLRTEYTVEDFMRQLNTDGYSLEFLYAYIGVQTFRFDCWLWFEDEPYHKECELIISAESVTYQWNEMYEKDAEHSVN